MDVKNLDACSRDLISSLPNELLGCIVSLLSTKEVVLTSLLSEKWRNVLRLVDNLDFDDSVSLDRKSNRFFPKSFKNFVDRTLALQFDDPIKKFSLKCGLGLCNDWRKTCVNRWISNFVEHGVLELDLRFKNHYIYSLPPQLLASRTLVKLTLGTQLSLRKLPSYVSLPSLKILLIDSVWFQFDDFSNLLLPGCTALEELSVHHDWVTEPWMIISNPTIKKLSVHRRDCESDIVSSSYMSFDTPSLIYLDYSDYALSYYPDCNLKSLVEARIDLNNCNWPDVTDFVMAIRNVQTLHLSPDFVDVITLCCNGLPIFDNLVKLSFGSNKKPGWKLLPYLLQQSPNLETLIIKDLHGYEDDISIPKNQVKVLHILSYGGSSEELKNLEIFLEKLEYLELVKVKVCDNGKILQTKSDLVMMLPRVSSSKCKIKVL